MNVLRSALCLWVIFPAILVGQETSDSKESSSADQPAKRIFAAKLVYQKLVPLNLSQDQLNAFEDLNRELTDKAVTARSIAGIDKDVMKRRDETHSALRQKGIGFTHEDYWQTLQEEGGLSDKQIVGFKASKVAIDKFKKGVLGILTEEQRREYGKSKRKAYKDNFADANQDGRVAERGEWKFENNQASCVADPELYKKFKNHGPILKWDREFTDAVVSFKMKASDCQRVVFTLNGDGHVFRVTLADETANATAGASKVPTRLIAWATKSSKQNKGDTIKPEGLPDLPAINDEWIPFKLSILSGEAFLTIGDFQADVTHEALSREKTNVTLTFAYGELAVRDFQMSIR